MDHNNTLHEREVLKLYYGWYTNPVTMRWIADILETSSMKIRQTKDRAIRKIRASVWGERKYKKDLSTTGISMLY